MTWVLILFVHAGILSGKDSMSLTTVYGFNSEVECNQAGNNSQNLVKNTVKDLKFVCVKQTK